MQNSLVKFMTVVVFGAAAYYALASALLPWAPVLVPRPGGYVALQLANTAVLLALSIPFALILASRRLSLKAPILAAICIALLGLVAPALPSFSLTFQPSVAGGSAALDFAKFALALPLLTWLVVRWLPSNNSFNPMPLRGTG